jgi:HD-like signal output (HDOD) protein
MWPLLIGLLLIIGILFVLFFFRGRKKPNSDIPKKGRADFSGKHPADDLRAGPGQGTHSPVPDRLPSAIGVLNKEPAVRDQTEELKERLREGVTLIFSIKPSLNSPGPEALQMADIDPEVQCLALEQIRDLRDFRKTYDLCRALDDPDSSMSNLAKVIVTDPILSGKILKIANSAYFGLQQKVNSIGQALMIIGLTNIKNLLYQEGLLKTLNLKKDAQDPFVESLWEHSFLTSISASHIQNLFPGLDKGTVFTLGLLHDVGKFILRRLPLRPGEGSFQEVPFAELSIREEAALFGIDHALLGRLAFEEWAFSDLMIKTVEWHHTPGFMEMERLELGSDDLKYLLVLFLSDQVAKLLADKGPNGSSVASLDLSYRTLFPKRKLLDLILDSSLFSEIKKAKAMMGSS